MTWLIHLIRLLLPCLICGGLNVHKHILDILLFEPWSMACDLKNKKKERMQNN